MDTCTRTLYIRAKDLDYSKVLQKLNPKLLIVVIPIYSSTINKNNIKHIKHNYEYFIILIQMIKLIKYNCKYLTNVLQNMSKYTYLFKNTKVYM